MGENIIYQRWIHQLIQWEQTGGFRASKKSQSVPVDSPVGSWRVDHGKIVNQLTDSLSDAPGIMDEGNKHCLKFMFLAGIFKDIYQHVGFRNLEICGGSNGGWNLTLSYQSVCLKVLGY